MPTHQESSRLPATVLVATVVLDPADTATRDETQGPISWVVDWDEWDALIEPYLEFEDIAAIQSRLAAGETLTHEDLGARLSFEFFDEFLESRNAPDEVADLSGDFVVRLDVVPRS